MLFVPCVGVHQRMMLIGDAKQAMSKGYMVQLKLD